MPAVALSSLVVGYIGNFGPAHSTENHVAASFESHGAKVLRLQEDDERTWELLPHLRCDLVVWTRTWARPTGSVDRSDAPLVGYHLDRWWGLDREAQITAHPREAFFDVDLLVTADGGHPLQWEAEGIRHEWLPPAVWGVEASVPGRRSGQYVSPIAFVGSWERYHAEWPWRMELVRWLRVNYNRRVSFWPRPGRRSIRGAELANLYASVQVVVGDSCLAGGATRYWSDRIPETLGRGGYLIHPHVEGLEEHFTPGVHLDTFTAGDLDELRHVIDRALADDERCRTIAAAGREHVLAHHTYERRVVQLVELAHSEGLLCG